jgi:hypothetical protein
MTGRDRFRFERDIAFPITKRALQLIRRGKLFGVGRLRASDHIGVRRLRETG